MEQTRIQKTNYELKVILLGASGSGKSSAGNVLLQQHGNEKGFKTSCSAKAETKKSSLKSVNVLMEKDTVRELYKVDIIDTPANQDTGLLAEDLENEMREAKRLSSPGPHAFLLCIPANAISKYFTKDVDYYNNYFDGKLYDSTIVVFTRCDEYQSENKREFDSFHAMKQNKILKRIKNHITLGNTLSEEEKINKLKEVISYVIDQKTDSSVMSIPVLYGRIFVGGRRF